LLFFLFDVLAFEESDDFGELLGIVGPNDTCWNDFAFLLGLVGSYQFLEIGGTLWEDNAVWQCLC